MSVIIINGVEVEPFSFVNDEYIKSHPSISKDIEESDDSITEKSDDMDTLPLC